MRQGSICYFLRDLSFHITSSFDSLYINSKVNRKYIRLFQDVVLTTRKKIFRTLLNYVGSEVFTAVVMKSIIFWDMTPYSALSCTQIFEVSEERIASIFRVEE
jgi:hypothetical protein